MSDEPPGGRDPQTLESAPPAGPAQPPAAPAPAAPVDPPPDWGAQHGAPRTPPTAYPPPMAYGQYGAPAPPAPLVPTNGLAIASLVLGIVSWLPFLWIGFIPGLVLGFVGKSQIDSSDGAQQGRGLAIAGIVLGLVGCGIMAAFILLFVLAGLAGTAGA